MHFKYALGAALALSAAAATVHASVYVTDRGDLTAASAQMQRFAPLGTDPIISHDVYSDFDSFAGLLPGSNMVSSSASGNMMDTATGLALVASGAASINATSSLSYDGDSNLNLYVVSGHYASTINSAAMAGYLPPAIDPDTFPYLTGGALYNSGISFLVSDVPATFTITLAQANSVGANLFNAGMLYKDANNDGNFIEADGDEMIQDYFVINGDGTDSRSGVLQPSASPYRMFFFGNSYDGTFDDNKTLTSSSDYTSTFSISVPEPTSIAGVALMGFSVLRRKRGQ